MTTAPAPLAEIADLLEPLRPPGGPFIIGVTGSVAVGKSTFAAALAQHYAASGERTELVATDGFLHSNAALTQLGLLSQKGVPATYDHAALAAALASIRAGPTIFPAYSHVAYDIDPALARRLEPPAVLIIEGLTLRHADTGPTNLLDALIYIEADETDLERWYVDRFMQLWEAAEHDPASFYARFRHMSREETEALARMVWRNVNLKTLHDHIVHARPLADLVVAKAGDHAIAAIAAAPERP